MGYKLRREIRDVLPAGVLTPSERLLVLEIADTCNDDTRTGWPGVEWLVSKCDIPTAKRVGEHFASIARKWFEIRVELGKDRHGKPFYAIPGKRMTFRMPTRPELVARHGDSKVPEIQGLDACKDPEFQGAKVPEIQGANPPESRDPSPQLEPLIKEPSSLSPREDEQPTAAPVPAPRPEREIQPTSSSKPKNEEPTPIHRLLLDAGCPPERLTEAERWITDECQPRGLGWWRKTGGNGDLKVHVAAFLGAGPAAEACPDCDGTGETGDWMNRHLCPCLWFTDPARARKDFVPRLKDLATCTHGIHGGDEKAPNGWQFCSECRGPGWVDPGPPPRVGNQRGGYIAQVSRSPADQRLIDAGPLYRKYAAREGKHQTFRNPPIDAYYGEL